MRTVRKKEYPQNFSNFYNSNEPPFIFAFWHSRIIFAISFYRNYPICGLISRHSDGEFAAATIEILGMTSARGSTSRGGGEALRRLVRNLRKGLNVGITPDGPRGPARKLQDGVITLGQISQRKIIPFSFSAKPAIRLKSWDRFLVPLPFSRMAVVYGKAFDIPEKMDRQTKERLRDEVEQELNRVTDLADEMVGQPRI
jgi:lysophospholipid acyltransferase (LPLAT)-like uncharacterized protein